MLRARVCNQEQLGDAKAFAFLPKLRNGGGHAECVHAAAGHALPESENSPQGGKAGGFRVSSVSIRIAIDMRELGVLR